MVNMSRMVAELVEALANQFGAKIGKNTGVVVENVKNDENFPKFAAKFSKQINQIK